MRSLARKFRQTIDDDSVDYPGSVLSIPLKVHLYEPSTELWASASGSAAKGERLLKDALAEYQPATDENTVSNDSILESFSAGTAVVSGAEIDIACLSADSALDYSRFGGLASGTSIAYGTSCNYSRPGTHTCLYTAHDDAPTFFAVLDDAPAFFAALADEPTTHSEEEFEKLAAENPNELLRLLVTGSLSPAELTFAAEIAGQIHESIRVRPALLALLEHASAIVREGAIYGLARHINNDVLQAMRRIAATDRSRGVREAALELL